MSVNPIASYKTNGTIDPSSYVDVVVTLDGASRTSLVISNDGSEDIDSIDVYASPLGNLEGPLTGISNALGTIADGTSKIIALDEGPMQSIRLRLNSTSGTTFALEARAG